MTRNAPDRPPPDVADSDASNTDHQIHDESMTENTDGASAAELRERVDELEAQIEQQQQTIQQMLPSRRSVIKAGGAGAAALLAASATAGSASAATGTIGSSSQRFDYFADTLDANVVDTDNLSGADILNAANGEVPQSDGAGNLAMATVGADIWTEESGSPYTASGANSINPSNLDSYDLYLVKLQAVDQASSQTNADMTVGGDTGTNYGWFGQDGSLTTGKSQFTRILSVSSNGTARAIVHLFPTGSNVGLKNLTGSFAGSVPSMGRNDSVSFPMNQFTVKRGVSTDWTVEVWGFNF